MMVEIRRMGPQIGVEVIGVDVKTLDDAGFAPIYRAWLDCNILVVRDQELEMQDYLHYSRRFGPVVPHPSKSTRHPEIPEITMLGIDKFDADGKLNDAYSALHSFSIKHPDSTRTRRARQRDLQMWMARMEKFDVKQK